MKKLFAATGLCCLLGACAGAPSVPASIADAMKTGCGAISIADGFFQASAPALVASGRLSQSDLAKEQAIFRTAESTCANPPADPVTAGTVLLADAASIYLMLSAK